MDTMNEVNQTDRRIGRMPLGRSHKLVIRVPTDVAMALRANAMARGTTMNEVINQRLRRVARDLETSQKNTPVAHSLPADATGVGINRSHLETNSHAENTPTG